MAANEGLDRTVLLVPHWINVGNKERFSDLLVYGIET